MCVICWKEFSEQNPAQNLGCGHYGCAACRASVSKCPVCNSTVFQASGARKRDSAAADQKQQHHHYPQHHQQQHSHQHQPLQQLLGSPPGRRARAYHEHITAFVTAAGAAAGARALTATASDAERAFDDLATSDDHFAPLATLGLADAATPPRLRMLERTPSGGADNDPASRAGSAGGGGGGGGGASRGRGAAAKRAMAVSARHIAHGGFVAGRALLTHALLPAARAGCAASCVVAAATCAAAAATGRAVAGAAGGVFRFASAPRVRVVGFDGEQDAAGAAGALTLAHGGASSSPEPISNLVGARIRVAGCRATRLRVEYCRDCLLVVTGLQDCELLLVGCSRLRLVLRGCSGLVLRELQCTDMGDCVRRRCERFSHEIVCLRCACKPMSGGGGGGWGLGGGAGFGQLQQQQQQQAQVQPYQHQQLHQTHQQQQQHHQQQQFQQLLHRYNSASSSTSSSAVFQGNGNWH